MFKTLQETWRAMHTESGVGRFYVHQAVERDGQVIGWQLVRSTWPECEQALAELAAILYPKAESIETEPVMKAGKNVWVSSDGERVRADERPEGTDWNRWYPCYPESRVRGDRYVPYTGGSEWEQAANAAMRDAAQANFARGH